MEILIWLAVPFAVTAVAMVWALWVGRSRRAVADARGSERPAKRDAAHARFSVAVQKPVPERARTAAARRPDRPSGIAVRPSQRRPR